MSRAGALAGAAGIDLRLEMRSDAAALSRARAWVTEVARQFGLDGRQAFALKTALSEALSNVIRHAYQGREGLPILLNCSYRRGRLVLAIRDYGRKVRGAFRRPRLPAPLAAKGYGLWMMYALVDRVKVDLSPEEGSILTLVKNSGGRR